MEKERKGQDRRRKSQVLERKGRRKRERKEDEGVAKVVMDGQSTASTKSFGGGFRRIQIFVKVDDSKAVAMEVSPKDKVQKILNTTSGSDQDVYVSCDGRVLRGSEELGSCGVRDGTAVQVVSRLRGGGRHRDKKSQKERKQAASPKRQQEGKCEEEQKGKAEKNNKGPAIQERDKDAVIQMIEEMEGNRKVIEWN